MAPPCWRWNGDEVLLRMELDDDTVEMHLTFNDVTVYFSEEEWKRLQHKELELYVEVMNDNYANLQALGLPVPESNLSQNVQQSEKRHVSNVSNTETPSRTPFQTGIPVPEPSLLQHGQHNSLVCNAGTPSDCPPQTGLPVPEPSLLQHGQQYEKSLVCNAGTQSHAPPKTGLAVPDPSLLQHGQQYENRLVCNAGTPSHAHPKTGLAVTEPSLLQHGQQYEKRVVCNAGTPSHAPPKTGLPLPEPSLLQHGQQYKSPVSNPTKPLPSPLQTECDPSNPKPQQELELQNLASFSKKMLHNSNLKLKCQTCKGILTCYCIALKNNKNKPFRCRDCGKRYGSEVYLILHQKTHLQEGFYKCFRCEKNFGKPKLLRRHVRTQHGEVYTCEQCRMVFSCSYQLNAHKKNHKQAKKHPCLICGQIFFVFTELQSHLKMHQKPYKCTMCGLVCPNKPDFVAHLREHTGEQIYKCKICQKIYTHLPFFTKHVSMHSAPGSADVKEDRACMQADYWQPSLPAENSTGPYEDGIKHIFSGLPPNRVLKTLMPPMASLSTTLMPPMASLSTTLMPPMASLSTTLMPPTTSLSTTLPPTTSLSTTLMPPTTSLSTTLMPPTTSLSTTIVTECNPFEAGKPVRCKRCKKPFRHHASFLRHRKSHLIRFVCSCCGQKFRKLIKLYLHRAEHQNYRPFNCKYCIQAFSCRSLLLLHLNTHRLARLLWIRYPCAYCRKVFRSPADRDIHHKTHVYQPGTSNTSIYPLISSNITIAPFTDQSTEHKKPLKESPGSRAYIKRLCYRPCD